MEMILQLSDIGLILDIAAIGLLAKYGLPTEPLWKDGRSNAEYDLGEPTKSLNKLKYQKHRSRTILAYQMLCVGFLLQLQVTHQVLEKLIAYLGCQ